jgi:hypothetical protein
MTAPRTALNGWAMSEQPFGAWVIAIRRRLFAGTRKPLLVAAWLAISPFPHEVAAQTIMLNVERLSSLGISYSNGATGDGRTVVYRFTEPSDVFHTAADFPSATATLNSRITPFSIATDCSADMLINGCPYADRCYGAVSDSVAFLTDRWTVFTLAAQGAYGFAPDQSNYGDPTLFASLGNSVGVNENIGREGNGWSGTLSGVRTGFLRPNGYTYTAALYGATFGQCQNATGHLVMSATLTLGLCVDILGQPEDARICARSEAAVLRVGAGAPEAAGEPRYLWQWKSCRAPDQWATVEATLPENLNRMCSADQLVGRCAFSATGQGTNALTVMIGGCGWTAPASVEFRCMVINTCETGGIATRVATVLMCPPDFNCSGAISVQDLFDFLAAYFSNDPRADFNASGAISVQDIFDFLAAYFAGC